MTIEILLFVSVVAAIGAAVAEIRNYRASRRRHDAIVQTLQEVTNVHN